MKYLMFYFFSIGAMVASYTYVISGKISFLIVLASIVLGTLWFFWGASMWFFKKDASYQKIVLTQCLMPAGLCWFLLSGWGSPMINDISTDLQDPPKFQHIEFQAGKEFPPQNIEIIKQSYPKLTSLILQRGASEVFDASVELISEMAGWEIVNQEFDMGVIEATTKTSVFRFVDDVVIRIRAEGENRARLDMRSKSRFGKGDRGVNAKRVLIFYEGITKKLQK